VCLEEYLLPVLTADGNGRVRAAVLSAVIGSRAGAAVGSGGWARALVGNDDAYAPFENDEKVCSHLAAVADYAIRGNNDLLAARSYGGKRGIIEVPQQFDLSQNLKIVRHVDLRPLERCNPPGICYQGTKVI
jgi:hypothetical protein